MRHEEQLYTKAGRDAGFRTPDGYFDNVFAKIEASLPDMPERPQPLPLSRWQRLKPYVYLAAMFAGIWLMMKVYTSVVTDHQQSADRIPESVALAFADSGEAAVDAAVGLPTAESDFELMQEVSENYTDIDDFESDFGYDFDPNYEKIVISDKDLDYINT